MSDDDMPALDDFEEDIKTVAYTHNPPNKSSAEDYTKPNLRHIEDEQKQKEELKQVQEKVQKLTLQV